MVARVFNIDETIADAFERGLPLVAAAASTSGAVLAPCFAPAFIGVVRARHFHAMVPVPYPPPLPPARPLQARCQ
jgi:hypothetical protein